MDSFTELGLPIKTSWGTAAEKAEAATKKADENALAVLYDMIMSKKHTTEELINLYDLIVDGKYDQLPAKKGSKIITQSEKYVPPQKKLIQTQPSVQMQHKYPQKRPNTIKIFDVPCHYGKEDIAAHLSTCGPIDCIKILLNDRGDSNNTVIVSFRLPFGVKRALETVDKRPWDGSIVNIIVLN